ncbi:RDD family protein [Micromonospora sp. MS34]|uniref:RDD family protein n=1 Tax=Micromonospora sp. MS34 TaxID=3385971 RepID=UPI0039A17ECA
MADDAADIVRRLPISGGPITAGPPDAQFGHGLAGEAGDTYELASRYGRVEYAVYANGHLIAWFDDALGWTIPELVDPAREVRTAQEFVCAAVGGYRRVPSRQPAARVQPNDGSPEGPAPPDPVRLAPHGSRLLAFVLDGVWIAIPIAALLTTRRFVDLTLTPGILITLIAALVAAHGLFTGMLTWLTSGQTFGKAFTGLVERRRDGTTLTMTPRSLAGAIARHSLGYAVIDVIGVGVLTLFASPRRRCLHDVVFGTEVVAVDAPARRLDRIRQLNEAREAGLERVNERWGWAQSLASWTSKVATMTAGAVAHGARAVRLIGPVAAPVSTAVVSQTPAGIALSTAATAGVAATTAVATAALGVAVAPQLATENLLSGVPRSGLVAAFVADHGVTISEANQVASWSDVTGTVVLKPAPEGDTPVRVPDGHAGHDLIRLPGSSMVGPADGFPATNSPRTIVVAGRWSGRSSYYCRGGTRGAGWGDPATTNGSFFAANDRGLEVAVTHGECPPSELLSTDHSVQDIGVIMMAASTDGETFSLYLRDKKIAESPYVFNTAPQTVWIGTWPGSSSSANLDVVAVLAYNRALSQEEITSIGRYLREKLGVDA